MAHVIVGHFCADMGSNAPDSIILKYSSKEVAAAVLVVLDKLHDIQMDTVETVEAEDRHLGYAHLADDIKRYKLEEIVNNFFVEEYDSDFNLFALPDTIC
tara:strand:- start:63196 stop:63495 length:300 start_codon:yes stop_codon:yes gene_type:complete